MSLGDKIKNAVEDLTGKGKEAVGKATGDKELQTEGNVDQTKASAKDTFTDAKDTVQGAKNSLTDK